MAIIPSEHRELLRSYRMPAEWERHLATYLVWPHNLETWPGKFAAAERAYATMAAAIAEFEPIRVLVKDEDRIAGVHSAITGALSRPELTERVEFLVVPTNDSWIRDYGPIFVNRLAAAGDGPAQVALNWRFNSWGRKYGEWALDDAVPSRLGERYGFPLIGPEIVLEGGSIEVNGAGALLTTESCLLNPNRNPHLGRGEVEDYLKTYLGVTQVLWLGSGIAGDDTDGHVDDLARFVAPDTIVTVVEQDPADANYKPLRDNLERLRAMRDRAGRLFKIATLPMPPAVIYESVRLPASYANFYLVNGGVVMPTFEAPSDEEARATLARLFPTRRVAGVPSADLVWGLGAVHCLTQQHPLA